jgi:predicted lipoprotein
MKKIFVITKLSLLAIVAIAIFSTGCSKDDDDVVIVEQSPDSFDREALLTNYANQYIKPGYTEYEAQVVALENAVSSFNNLLDLSSLSNVRTAWKNALLTWQDVSFLEFGPASNISLRGQTNVYPIDAPLIQSNIASGSYNLQQAGNLDAKGFQAIDYLLYGVAANDADIVSYFTNAPNARTYLADVANELKVNATTVKNDWFGTYASSFIANSASNADGSSVSVIVNTINLHYEKYLRNGKLGFPLNVFDPFTTQTFPEKVEAYYHGQSLPYLYRSLSSLQTFINGNAYANSATGIGFDDYISFVNGQTDGQPLQTVINNQFSTINAELANINDPLANEVSANNPALTSLYEEIQQMVAYIKVDMSDALEVIITYDSGDGD